MTLCIAAVAASQPLVSYTPASGNSTNGTLYQLYMLDLTLPNNSGSSVPGIVANRTVRLHWWQTNLTLSANGSLAPAAGSSIGPAPYQGPAPPASDAIPHTYAFYLFRQPANYSVPANFTSLPGNSTLRNGFNIANAVAAVGQPIAGDYFLASQNFTTVSNATSA